MTTVTDSTTEMAPVLAMELEPVLGTVLETRRAPNPVLETATEYADMLNAPLIDVKKAEKIEAHYDEKAYDRFIDRYIVCTGKKEYSNAQLIIQFLNGLERKL